MTSRRKWAASTSVRCFFSMPAHLPCPCSKRRRCAGRGIRVPRWPLCGRQWTRGRRSFMTSYWRSAGRMCVAGRDGLPENGLSLVRRGFAAALGLTLIVLPPVAKAVHVLPHFEAILLGTGYPRPDPEHAGPALAIVAGQRWFLVDAGRRATLRIAATDLKYESLGAVFLTHLHSDHTAR